MHTLGQTIEAKKEKKNATDNSVRARSEGQMSKRADETYEKLRTAHDEIRENRSKDSNIGVPFGRREGTVTPAGLPLFPPVSWVDSPRRADEDQCCKFTYCKISIFLFAISDFFLSSLFDSGWLDEAGRRLDEEW